MTLNRSLATLLDDDVACAAADAAGEVADPPSIFPILFMNDIIVVDGFVCYFSGRVRRPMG